MARKADAHKRRELTEKAFLILQERGPQITMRDLAAALEIKRPTLYWYFSDLPAVLDAIIELKYGELAAHLRERIDPAAHPVDLLVQLIEGVVGFFDGQEGIILLLFQFWATTRTDLTQVLARGREFIFPIRELLVRQLEHGVESGRVAPCDAKAVVDLVFALLDGTMVQRITRGVDHRPVFRLVTSRILDPLRLAPDATVDAGLGGFDARNA
ncbi:MAG: TetR/AcrR family transcriptional regulator [Myxococcales bacterium]|nr:TetR/AcrR family transcriptional regulator [Myxococcales bacterium]